MIYEYQDDDVFTSSLGWGVEPDATFEEFFSFSAKNLVASVLGLMPMFEIIVMALFFARCSSSSVIIPNDLVNCEAL